ncbi:TonB-dependent receptor [Sphingomonas ginsenosidivorax]|uniref:TonB-dependent receptor n=1 Tax=Sphingomonas ginsenosidivorax TaxID=862135 RepID=A0A5C6UK94_9SPHN|nr:TonB-dependent receptor [Sphingomonas ginsenosidivorax]TXC72641.1 TonB-dependent receptor [Sphingomonas ginsenosidivorax]
MTDFATASRRFSRLSGVSGTALALSLLLPASAFAQAAAIPQTATPGTPAQTDPSPAQTAIAPAEGANDPAATTAAPQTVDADSDADIVVTGFRRSLDAALNVKRESVSAVDAIVAEDIAKFPDQNLAESLQRIPGISIQRDAGEGRAITVRGLGAQFTRVRVNGMETVATSTDGASANRDRAFDFNVFASELFNSIVVHKTAEASLDEGSLGAVVDLNTGNPLGGKAGFTFVASAQASYNDLSKNTRPRLAGLLSFKSPDGTFGASVSAAYSKTDNLELGNNTTRWAQARFDSVNGTPCFFNSNTGTTRVANAGGFYRPSAACDQAALAFHPRIPRYGEIFHGRERLGITGSVQWSPSDATKISIDGLYSRFKETREEKWGEVLLRSNERSIDLSNVQYDNNNNLIAATLNDAWVRTEHYLRKSKTEFYQLGGSWDQDVTDRLRFTLMGGFSKSTASIPVETTFVFDDRDATGYRYDYTNSRSPLLTFGTSVTDPANFQLAEIRDRPSETVNKFRTAQLRTEYDVAEGFKLKLGGLYRKFSFDTEAYTRDAVICPAAGRDVVLGTITCSAASLFGPTAVYGYPAGNLGETFTVGKAGQPSGNTNAFLIPNIDASAAFTGLYNRPKVADAGNIRSVSEEVTGGYGEVDVKGSVLGLDYAANAGVRYVHTAQSSTGLNNGLAVTIARSYDDWLPAINVALFPTSTVILRGAISKVLTRPTLGNLTPGGSVDGFNYRVTFGNPQLDPFRATAFDLAAEWYFAPQSIFSVAAFKKKVESFPVSQSVSGSFESTGLPRSVIPPSSPAALPQNADQLYTITSPVNGSGASLKGVEIALQTTFRFLPGFLKNFGAIANATFIDSTATYTVQGPTVNPCVAGATPAAACTFGPNVSVSRKGTLFGLSKRQYNGTLYYEDAKFSARSSISYRGPYVDQNSATGNVFEGYNSTINVDASVRYKLTPSLEISLEGTNLTDEYRDRYTDLDANRNYENNHFGRTFLAGARFKM